jgi:hypothetical protein
MLDHQPGVLTLYHSQLPSENETVAAHISSSTDHYKYLTISIIEFQFIPIFVR